MRVIVNGEQREINASRVDALLSELEYEGTHFAIARELRRAAEEPLGRDGAEDRRRDRDHHAAAGRVRMVFANSLHPSSLRTQGPIATGRRGYERSLPLRQHERSRGMGPGVRRDDEIGR